MPRPSFKRAEKVEEGGAYFASPKKDLAFIKSGCKLLDCVLGGGYPLGRIVNLVGDKSTGKTLLAIEACANFARDYSGPIWYAEAEAAFDKDYAEALGLPVDRVEFAENIYTVEDWYEHLESVLDNMDDREPGLYILDSLDALSDRAEQERKIDDGSYGANKAKKMGELFRRLVKKVEQKSVCIIVISQIRDAIGVMFGKKHTRSGGKALDFYASQVVWLAHIQTLKRTIKKVDRAVGVKIKAKCEKNKIGLPLRECQFPIMFGYGVDDMAASLEWLKEIDRLDLVGVDANKLTAFINKLDTMPVPEGVQLFNKICKVVENEWFKIEKEFLPTRKKY